MPTLQVNTRKANAQEIKDHQEKIAATKELFVRITLTTHLGFLAMISSFTSPEPELGAGIIAGILLAKQVAKTPANALYAAGTASALFGAGISLAEYSGIDTALSSIGGSVALAGYTLFATADAIARASAQDIPADKLYITEVGPVGVTPA